MKRKRPTRIKINQVELQKQSTVHVHAFRECCRRFKMKNAKRMCVTNFKGVKKRWTREQTSCLFIGYKIWPKPSFNATWVKVAKINLSDFPLGGRAFDSEPAHFSSTWVVMSVNEAVMYSQRVSSIGIRIVVSRTIQNSRTSDSTLFVDTAKEFVKKKTPLICMQQKLVWNCFEKCEG